MSSRVGWFGGWRIIATLLLAAGALVGCSTLGIAYKQADSIGYWWLDGYFDFDERQSSQVRQALGRLLAWHRREQLADVVTLAERAAVDVVNDATPAQACGWYEDIRARLDAVVERALPETAALAATLHQGQFAQLERKQVKNDAEYRDKFLQPDSKERREAAVERAVERAEQLYGRLGAAQKAVLARGVAESPFDPERWHAERQRRQRDLVAILRGVRSTDTPADRDAAVRALRGWWQRVQRSPDAGYASYQRELEAYNCEFAARVHNATTKEQRAVAQRRLRGWEADLRRFVTPAS